MNHAEPISGTPTAGALLRRISERVVAPRALVFRGDDRILLERAIERARAQLLEGPEPVLTVAVAGGTGAGKSTLINALAGGIIARASPVRPTTTRLCVYHHAGVVPALPPELAGSGGFVEHDRPELRNKVVVDTPDLDSYAREHRTLTKALLKAAGLVLYVFTPQNYRDERVWSVLEQERRFSACAVVLNKADLLTAEELELVAEDIRRTFARIGLAGVRIFRTAAAAHLPGVDPGSWRDDLPALRAYLERELQSGDVARLMLAARRRAVTHLAETVERLAPAAMVQHLQEAAAEASERIPAAADRLTRRLGDGLAAVENELAPLAVIRLHERFRGPLRTWLGLTDFLRFGLSGFVRTLFGRPARGERGSLERLLGFSAEAAEDVLRAESQAIQDRLFARGLPIARWRMETQQTPASKFAEDVAAEIERRFESSAAGATGGTKAVIWTASFLGAAGPAAAVGGGLYVMAVDLLATPPQYIGLPLLGHLAAMTALYIVVLHGLTAALLPSPGRTVRGIGEQAVRAALARVIGRWMTAYRTDLEADLADIREPVAVLLAALPAPAPELQAAPAPLAELPEWNDAEVPVPVSESAAAIPAPAAEPAAPPKLDLAARLKAAGGS